MQLFKIRTSVHRVFNALLAEFSAILESFGGITNTMIEVEDEGS